MDPVPSSLGLRDARDPKMTDVFSGEAWLRVRLDRRTEASVWREFGRGERGLWRGRRSSRGVTADSASRGRPVALTRRGAHEASGRREDGRTWWTLSLSTQDQHLGIGWGVGGAACQSGRLQPPIRTQVIANQKCSNHRPCLPASFH